MKLIKKVIIKNILFYVTIYLKVVVSFEIILNSKLFKFHNEDIHIAIYIN